VAAVFMGLALLSGLAFGRLLRLSKEDTVTVGIGFADCHVAVAPAIAIKLLNRIENTAFLVIYSLAKRMPPGGAAWRRAYLAPTVQQAQ
jgi:hypothetical protein